MKENCKTEHEQPRAQHRGYEAFRASLRKTKVESEARTQKYRYFQKPENWVALLTLLFVGAYTGITYRQLITSQNQTFAADQSLIIANQSVIAENRAWLDPQTPKFSFAIEPLPNGMENGVVDMVGATQNVGKEPATDTIFSAVEANFIAVPDTDPRDFAIPRDDVCPFDINWIKSNRPLPNASIIFPGENLSYERYFSFSNPATAQLLWNDVLRGGEIFYEKDCVVYRTFGAVHRSAFCFYYMYDPLLAKMESYHCPHGNEAN